MSSKGPLQFLELNGGEIANVARTLEYQRNGLGSPNFHIEPGVPCGVLYRQLGGTCGAPDTFISPAADPAPWYDPLRSESADFLGLWLVNIEGYDSPIQRSVTQRGSGLSGGTLASERNAARVWKFRGYLISNSDEGAEYGLEWLTYALSALASGSGCDACGTSSMRVYISCPDENCADDHVGEWWAYDAALTEGPKEVSGDLSCRDAVLVEFTITCGNPFLYKEPVACLAPDIVGYDFGDTIDNFCYWLTGVPN